MDRLSLTHHMASSRGRFASPPLQPIARVLEAVAHHAPSAAQRASDALTIMLDGVLQSPWQDVAWRFSRLTGDGYPVEFTYCSHDTTIRYTAEVAGPEYPEALRLARAREVLSSLGVTSLQNSILDVMSDMQAGHDLRYGAWLSGRHSAERDQYKLYAEVPDNGAPAAEALLSRQHLTAHSSLHLRMIGYEVGSGRTEFYFRVHHLDDDELKCLLCQVGLADRVVEFWSFIESLSGRPIQQFFPKSNVGLSLSWQGEVPIFTLLVSARSVFGSDARIRRRVLDLALQHGWPLAQSGYELATQPLAILANQWKTQHGLVGLTIAVKGAPILSVGLRPF